MAKAKATPEARQSVYIDPDLYAHVKAQAAIERKTVTVVLDEALRAWLKSAKGGTR
jgi:hypothetical protein